MKIIILLFLVLLLVSPAFAELTKEDIRTIVKEENAASEKRMKEYIDLKIETVNARIDAVEKSLSARIDAVEKSLNARIDATNVRIDGLEKSLNTRIDGLDKRMNNMWRLMMGLFGLVAATIAVPQIIVAYRDRGRRELQTEIEQLRDRLEALENIPS